MITERAHHDEDVATPSARRSQAGSFGCRASTGQSIYAFRKSGFDRHNGRSLNPKIQGQ